MNIISGFKLIDAFTIFIFLRITYIAIKRPLANELFKFLGIVCAAFFSLQYYPLFLKAIVSRLPFSIGGSALDVFSLLIIFLFCYYIFVFARKIFSILFESENIASWQRITAAFLGFMRAALFISLVLFMLTRIPVTSGVSETFSFKTFSNVTPLFYKLSFKGYKKMRPEVAINETVANYPQITKIEETT
jgi:uncharacterized membrane protein required for colicin V production